MGPSISLSQAPADVGWRVSQNGEGWLDLEVHVSQWTELKGHRDDIKRIMEEPGNFPYDSKGTESS